jgi:hypothetical protein
LNFASGYRIPLRAQTGRGAWDSIRALAFALYISSSSDGDYLSAKGMRALTIGKIAELMGINLHVERPHGQIPGVVIGELGGPLYELVKLIEQVLKETGEILERSGYKNLGAFVAEALQQAGKVLDKSNDAAVEVILERVLVPLLFNFFFLTRIYLYQLVFAFPAFRDMSQVNGQRKHCCFFLFSVERMQYSDQSCSHLLLQESLVPHSRHLDSLWFTLTPTFPYPRHKEYSYLLRQCFALPPCPSWCDRASC